MPCWGMAVGLCGVMGLLLSVGNSTISNVEDHDGKNVPALFARKNLIAWCIVPFDSKKRGPEERAAMLERYFAISQRGSTVRTERVLRPAVQ